MNRGCYGDVDSDSRDEHDHSTILRSAFKKEEYPPIFTAGATSAMPTRPKTLLAVPFDCCGIHPLNRKGQLRLNYIFLHRQTPFFMGNVALTHPLTSGLMGKEL